MKCFSKDHLIMRKYIEPQSNFSHKQLVSCKRSSGWDGQINCPQTMCLASSPGPKLILHNTIGCIHRCTFAFTLIMRVEGCFCTAFPGFILAGWQILLGICALLAMPFKSKQCYIGMCIMNQTSQTFVWNLEPECEWVTP